MAGMEGYQRTTNARLPGRFPVPILCILSILLSTLPALAGLTRHDVLVIANSNSPRSQAVASYYAAKRGIPASHVKLISCCACDLIQPADYAQIRDQVKAHLLSLGSDPDHPESDPIKAIVLTFDIPHFVSDGGETYGAVDSSLAAIFSECTWGKDPIGIYGLFQPAPGAPNPYYGDYAQPIDFGEFRKDVAASTSYEAFPTPGFTVVRMLDPNTALAAGGGGVIFRGVRSGDLWTWSPVEGRNRGSIGWRISDISVRDATHAYACTGNDTKPHGGGTIIATSNAGQTWTVVRRSSRITLFKLKDALMGVDFADPQRGWAVGTSQLYNQSPTPLMIRTTNGGGAWSDISTGLPSSFFPRAVSAADASNVWICGAGGAIYRSTNGGDTWALANSGAPATNYTSIWIRYSDGAYRGWATGSGGTIVRTEDGSNWTVEAAGLTTSDITDFAVFDQDHACAAYGETSFLKFTRGVGWTVEATGLAPIVSVATVTGSEGIAVGGTRYILAESVGGWGASRTVPDTAWRLRYLVTRLDGLARDVDPADGMPDDVKAMIDRGAAANAPGMFVIDEPTSIEGTPVTGVFADVCNALLPITGPSLITYDTTSTFLTHQSNVIGYTSWGMHDSHANSYTTWGRPFNTWANGGVATVFESGDGNVIDELRYGTGFQIGGTIYPGKLSVSGFPSTPPYSGYRAALLAANGQELASGVLSAGRAQIDLSGVVWPTDHQTYVQIYWPPDDPQFPSEPLERSRYPYTTTSTEVYDNRAVGFSLIASLARTRMAEITHEGGSGGIANVSEPWSNYCGQPQHLFPRYAMGFTWAEAAYMGLPGIGWQELAFGDPLMAPFATPPTVSITNPALDSAVISGTTNLVASAAPTNAPGIARVEFWLDDDTLLASDEAAPFETTLDTVARGLSDGAYTLEAIAFESGPVRNTGATTRRVVVSNNHTLCPRIADALALTDGTPVALERKTVSARFGQFLYMEDLDRTHGIRVRTTTPVTEGSAITVLGTLQTVDGEREVVARTLVQQ